MIALLRGRVAHREAGSCIVDVQGVGYEVFAPLRALETWSGAEEVEIHVATHVREDAITLYGFPSRLERTTFGVLTGVSGVGPKVALATLDTFSVPELARAVETRDLTALGRISGVGKKTAQRLALELEGKIPASFEVPAGAARAPVPTARAASDHLVLALQRLGYNKTEIDGVAPELAARGVATDAPVSERLRTALQILSGTPR